MSDQMDLGFEPDSNQRALMDAVRDLPSAERFKIARGIAGNEWRGVGERRDPSGATLKATWTGPGQAQIPQWNPDVAISMSYLLNCIVFACVNAIANAFVQAPFVAGSDPKLRRNINSALPLAKLLGPPPGTPCPKWTARKLLQWSVRSKIVTGKCGWEIEGERPRGKGKIVRLWPLVASLLNPVPTDGGIEYFKEFKYGPAGRTKRTLTNDQVFYVWNAGLSDPREPESSLQAARLDTTAATMFDRYTIALLKNHNVPANIISYLEFEDEDEELAWQRQFTGHNLGPDQAGRTLFHKVTNTGSEGGDVKNALIVQQLGALQKDTQALETYRIKVMNICIAIGVPMSMLDASNRTFSNGGLEAQNFYQQRMKPEWQEWEEEINSQIAPRLGKEVGWFDLTNIQALRPPMKFQQVDPTRLRDAEIAHRDEIRDEFGWGPWEEATARLGTPDQQKTDDKQDAVVIQHLSTAASILIQNGFSRESVAKALGLPAGLEVAAVEPAATDPAAQDEPPVLPPPPVPIRLAVRERRALDPEVTRVAVVAVTAGLEGQWERAWGRFFTRQMDATLSRLNGKRGRQMLSEFREVDPLNQPVDSLMNNIFDHGFWLTTTEDFAAPLLEGVFTAGGARVAGQFGIGFDLQNPGVSQAIASRSNFLANRVTDTTFGELQTTLIEGVQAGEDIAKLSSRVTDVFATRSTTDAQTIARTEVVGAFQQASHSFARALPATVVAGHSWLAHHDSRVRESHADPELAKPVAMAEPFRIGGYHMMHPGDSSGPPEEVINCRCIELFYAPEDMPGFGSEPARHLPLVGRNHTVRVLRGLADGSTTPEEALLALSANGGPH